MTNTRTLRQTLSQIEVSPVPLRPGKVKVSSRFGWKIIDRDIDQFCEFQDWVDATADAWIEANT